ncbi:hypothetical protein OG943_10845 [Amycolatopsis sp. NBC_00345]|uniref:hypothetical protein n=1 Tax=Amycolatopsis sp. NBC_00345 TaxID=2975955 RepID=UPI002E266014
MHRETLDAGHSARRLTELDAVPVAQTEPTAPAAAHWPPNVWPSAGPTHPSTPSKTST